MAEHHYLVEDFAVQRFADGRFYDVVIFRFMRAVKQYDERDDLKQYKFSTIANNAMLGSQPATSEKKEVEMKVYKVTV